MDGASREQFEQAVLLSFNQGADANYRSAALASLDQLKRAPDGWRFCLEGLVQTGHVEVKFWCLQALCELVQQGRYAAFGPEDAGQLQHALFTWLERTPAGEQAFIKNKLAQLLVLVVEVDYPERWAGFFHRLLAFLQQGETAVDLFLRILSTLHEETFSADAASRSPDRLAVANRIKDALRLQAITSIVEALFAIMARTARTGEQMEHCLQALHVLRLYVPWVDISLVANDSFLPLLHTFARHPRLHDGACGVLTELVVKGMEPRAKLAHLAVLNLEPTLHALAQLNFGPAGGGGGDSGGGGGAGGAGGGGGGEGGAGLDLMSSGEEEQGGGISQALATLVCAVAVELLEGWDKLPPTDPAGVEACERLHALLPLVLFALESAEVQISHSAAPFLHAYLLKLKKANLSEAQLQPHKPALQRTLLALTRRLCYREDYAFDEPDEPEADFQNYRKDLATLYKACARVDREGALAFTSDLLSRTVERPPSEVPFAHAEVVLFLLYQLGEGLPEAAFRMDGGAAGGDASAQPGGDGGGGGGGAGAAEREGSAFARLLVLVCRSGLSAYPHRAVQLLYFELAVRYARFFALNPPFIPAALEPMCDGRGLHNRDAEVRGRVCYLLLRLVKVLSAQPQPHGGGAAAGGGGGGGSAGGAGGGGARGGGASGEDVSAHGVLKGLCEKVLVAIEPLLRVQPLPDDSALPMAQQSALRAARQAQARGGKGEAGGRTEGGGFANGGPAAERGAPQNGAGASEGGGGGGGGANDGEGGSALAVLESEQLHLYEVAGVLLGGGLASPDVSARLLLLLLAPLSDKLSRLQHAQQLVLARRAQRAAAALPAADGGGADAEGDADAEAEGAAAAAHIVSALGTLSKGFTHASAVGVQPIFASSLEAALQTAAVFPRSAEIRSRVLMLLHRMVECLGEGSLTYLQSATPQLLAHAQPAELHEVVTLLNQAVAKLKGSCLPHLVVLTPLVTHALFEAMGGESLPRALPPNAPVPESERERALLLRFYLSFVHGLVHNGLVCVFVSPPNDASLERFLSVLIECAVDAPDAQMQRQCVSVLHRLVEIWAGPHTPAQPQAAAPPVGSVPGFDSYALTHIAPALLRTIVHPYLNLKDAGALQLLEAVAGCQQALHGALGVRYASFLLESALPALGCSPELAATFVQHAASALPNQRPVSFRDFLRSFVENYHASRRQLQQAGGQ